MILTNTNSKTLQRKSGNVFHHIAKEFRKIFPQEENVSVLTPPPKVTIITSTELDPKLEHRPSVTRGLSRYGPWGYLMLGMLLCGGALLICGLWGNFSVVFFFYYFTNVWLQMHGVVENTFIDYQSILNFISQLEALSRVPQESYHSCDIHDNHGSGECSGKMITVAKSFEKLGHGHIDIRWGCKVTVFGGFSPWESCWIQGNCRNYKSGSMVQLVYRFENSTTQVSVTYWKNDDFLHKTTCSA